MAAQHLDDPHAAALLTPLGRLRARLREPPSFWLTRFLLLRLLGLVYLFAFLSLARQVLPLLGSRGLTPAADLLAGAREAFGSSWSGFLAAPSVFWLGAPDGLLAALAWVGVALAAVVLAGYANAVLLAALWAIYFSFVTVGQVWFGYGWETQLLETGFLACFLVPLLDGRPFPRRRPPRLVILLFRWLVLRIMLGAGLIKLRGDPCWTELTCLDVHFETQPLPNPLSPALHALPGGIHRLGVLINHACELIAPLFVFGPRRARHVAGLAMLVFQLVLIASGNLSFLNWLTIVAIVACFDDDLLSRACPRALRRRAEAARAAAAPSRGQRAAVLALFGAHCLFSIDPLINLLSPEQKMNASFNRLHLASAYGAFGAVTDTRHEIVFEGTSDEVLTDRTAWRAIELPCKPGDPMRRPCIAAPYHHRLDWQMWFAAMSPDHRDAPWAAHLAWKLLRGDRSIQPLMGGDPFPDAPPRWIRARRFRYTFAGPEDPAGAWWHRELVGTWLGPWSLDSPELRHLAEQSGWQ